MFEECVAPLVDGLFQGYNATVLAYGQVMSTPCQKKKKKKKKRRSFNQNKTSHYFLFSIGY
jgi:hypothetical protein